jgi:hypothetical protein
MPRRLAPPPVTDELLRLAWQRVKHPGWPATLAAALEHPLYRICLHGIARNLARRPAKAAPPNPPLFPDLEPPA